MVFSFTPEEAQETAVRVAEHMTTAMGLSVEVEKTPWPDAPLRTTLSANDNGMQVLIEVQGTKYEGAQLKDLAAFLAHKRHYAELYLSIKSDTVITVGMYSELQKAGIGLFIVDDSGNVELSIKPRNPALVITPNPALSYGQCAQHVKSAVDKFNGGDRKDGLRDLCELVEGQTQQLAIKASRKGWISKSEADILAMSFSNLINCLAAAANYTPGRAPIVSEEFKTDLHSFRNARNLVDHPVNSRANEVRRQRQFAERMMMGPRLVSELVLLKRKVH